MILPDNFHVAARAAAPVYMAAPNTPPYTSPELTANLVMRVLLATIANLVCLVPLRILYRNGEIAAVIFIATVELKNLWAILFALLWRNDDMESWWPGYGLCDFYSFFYNASAGLYVTCLLAIMRNLAHQVGLLRANPLTVNEKRRRNIIQMCIIFPLPIVQIAFTYPLAEERYNVGTLMGCSWVPSPSWPYIVFFVMAQPVVSVITAIYAIITFWRFRQVAKMTKSVLSTNRHAAARSQRTKRRLYLMVLSILVPFLPIVFTLCALNVLALGHMEPFDYKTIHSAGNSGIPWAAVTLLPSRVIDFGSFNNAYISIITAVPIFIFFGMTKDAMNSYRMIFVFLGLGRIWSKLHNEYDPDRSAARRAENSSGNMITATTAKGSRSAQSKLSQAATNRSVSSDDTVYNSALHVSSFLLANTAESGKKAGDRLQRWSPPIKNPFTFRTGLNLHMPFTIPGLSHKTSQFSMQSQNVPLRPVRSAELPSPTATMISGSLPPIPSPMWQLDELDILGLPEVLPSVHSKERSVSFDNVGLSRNGTS